MRIMTCKWHSQKLFFFLFWLNTILKQKSQLRGDYQYQWRHQHQNLGEGDRDKGKIFRGQKGWKNDIFAIFIEANFQILIWNQIFLCPDLSTFVDVQPVLDHFAHTHFFQIFWQNWVASLHFYDLKSSNNLVWF